MLEKILEFIYKLDKEKIKNIFYGILVLILLGAFVSLFNSKNDTSKKYLTKENKFDLGLAMGSIASSKSQVSSDKTEEFDYVNENKNNLTADLIQNIILAQVYFKTQNINDTTKQTEIIKDVAQSYKDLAKGKVYTANDLNISGGEDKAFLQDYQNRLYAVGGNYFDLIAKENAKFSPISPTPNPSQREGRNAAISTSTRLALVIKVIDNNILILNNTINDLLSIPANQSGYIYQLAIINYFAKQLAYLKSLTQINSDPLKFISLGGEDYAKQSQIELQKVIQDINEYFNSR